jgi:hypothetical protein
MAYQHLSILNLIEICYMVDLQRTRHEAVGVITMQVTVTHAVSSLPGII